MDIKLIVIFIVMFLIIFGGGSLLVVWKIKQLDEDSPIDDNIDTAQKFLPFKEVRDGVIDLGEDEYRAVIECSSTNFSLKTDNEKTMIEASFQRFVNSLTFPVTFFIQTKTINNVEMFKGMEEEISKVVEKHPNLKEYAESYYNEMTNLESYTENNRQKKKYIIVPYDESQALEELTNKEKKEHSISEVKQRALILKDNLSTMGIKGDLLDTAGLAELIYSTYHKDNYGNVKNVINGEFLSLLVAGDRNPQQEMSNDEKMKHILYNTKKRIENELIKPHLCEKELKDYRDILHEVEKIEKKFIKEW